MHSFTIGIIMAALAAPGFAQDVMNGTATIAGPTPATGGLNLAELLSDPKYAPFIQIVRLFLRVIRPSVVCESVSTWQFEPPAHDNAFESRTSTWHYAHTYTRAYRSQRKLPCV
jgi:hypothetical protein